MPTLRYTQIIIWISDYSDIIMLHNDKVTVRSATLIHRWLVNFIFWVEHTALPLSLWQEKLWLQDNDQLLTKFLYTSMDDSFNVLNEFVVILKHFLKFCRIALALVDLVHLFTDKTIWITW